jgi:hypothetical protein
MDTSLEKQMTQFAKKLRISNLKCTGYITIYFIIIYDRPSKKPAKLLLHNIGDIDGFEK